MRIPSPVIIIGMHRSGTSFVAKLLEEAGIFMGVIKDHNYEAMHFLSLNQQTLWKANADWLNPVVPDKINWTYMPAEILYKEHFRIASRLQSLKLRLSSKAWGWKDPRNTFTLPMWLHLFPNARILKVERDTEAVLKSLQTRNNTRGEVFDERLNNRKFCLDLIEKYQHQANTYKSHPAYFEVHYEDLTGKVASPSHDVLAHITGMDMKELITYYLH